MYIPRRRFRGLGQVGIDPGMSVPGEIPEGMCIDPSTGSLFSCGSGAAPSMPPGQCVSTITGLSVPCPSPDTVSTKPPSQVVGGDFSFWFQQNKGLVWGGVALVGGLLLLKACTR